MLDTTFDKMWEAILFPMSQELYNYLIEINQATMVSIHNLPQDKDNLKSLYETTKNTLKQKYHFNNLDKVRKIDIHKVAACFASVIMEYKIFQYDVGADISDEVFLLNARLAYSVSLAIIKEHLIIKYQGDHDKINYLKNNQLYMPKTTEGHDSFSLGRIKTLALNDIFLEDFDILSYSDMLYWIELFNIMILEDKKAIEYDENKEQDE